MSQMPRHLKFDAAPHHCYCHQIRTFINARIKWVRDHFLDAVVEREKNLKSLLSLKSLILSQPSQTLSLSTISPLKPILNLPISAEKFIRNYPLIFKLFLPSGRSNSLPHVKLTSRALSLHQDEALILGMSHYREDLAKRLSKLLMIARVGKLPLWLIDIFRYDLGLPHDYLLSFLVEFPEYFQICEMGVSESSGDIVFGLELVSWRDELAVSEMERRKTLGEMGMNIRYSMKFPDGFDLQKRVIQWMDDWQNLPYISPYENAFHLSPNSDHAERWAVGIIHELLSLLVPKKTERENLFQFADFLGIGRVRFKKALVHFSGIFYTCNKIRTQTVVLKEAFRKRMLIENHPLMVMRFKYVSAMNLVLRRGKPYGANVNRNGKLSRSRRRCVKVDHNRMSRSEVDGL